MRVRVVRRAVAALVVAALLPAGAAGAATSVIVPTSTLSLGQHGPAVASVQRSLRALGYWPGRITGVFNDTTQQAVYALQKAAGLARDGVVGPDTMRALTRGVRPRPRSRSGYVVEINLARDLMLLVRNGRLLTTLNVSTGGGYDYSVGGQRGVAVTPRGHFRLFRQVNRMDVSPLGELWRPKYFSGGYAIHGSSYVPPYPASHGCVRVSNAAMDWLWASKRMPLGTHVWVYGPGDGRLAPSARSR